MAEELPWIDGHCRSLFPFAVIGVFVAGSCSLESAAAINASAPRHKGSS